MPGPRTQQAAGSAALERVVTRARSAMRPDCAALLIREGDGLLLVAGDPGVEEAATCVLDAGRAVVIRDARVAAGVPVEVAGQQRGALGRASYAAHAVDEAQLELRGDLAALAGDLLEHAERRAQLTGAVEAGVEALAGLLDLRDGSLPRGAGEVVSLARRVADRLAEADPAAAGEVRGLLREHGVARPAPGPFPPRPAAPPPPP